MRVSYKGIVWIALGLLPITGASKGTNMAVNQSECCTLIEQALKDAAMIKAGATRADVEKNFLPVSGGATFGNEEVFQYKKCNLIKIKVTFSSSGKNSGVAANTVAEASELSIGYETKD